MNFRNTGCDFGGRLVPVWIIIYVTGPWWTGPFGTGVAPVIPRRVGSVVSVFTFSLAVGVLGVWTFSTVPGPPGEGLGGAVQSGPVGSNLSWG